MKRLKLLVIGSSGLVGSNFHSNEVWEVFGCSRTSPLDQQKIAEHFSIDVFSANPNWNEILRKMDAILFLAFPTNLDELESWSEEKRSVLVSNFTNITQQAKNLEIPTLFVSSDAVLWGLPPQERTSNSNINSLLNVYAILKRECELSFLANLPPSSFVIRCTPVGIHAFVHDHGFVGKLLTLSVRDQAKGFEDSIFSPVSINIFKNIVNKWIDSFRNLHSASDINRIIHLGPTNVATKYEFMLPLVHKIGGTIVPVSMETVSFKARRVKDQSFVPSSISLFEPFTVEDVLSDLNRSIDENWSI